MRAVMVREIGGPDVFSLEEIGDPQPGGGQILVRVAVSGVNYLDVYQRSGASPLTPPFVAGVEGVGTVVALDKSVHGLTIGQRVGWMSGGQGSFADLVVVAADKAVPIPDGVDDITAAALLMQGITAQYLVTDTYPVNRGDTALIHACAGGVGQLLTQMVKTAGGTVIGTVSTPEKAEIARSVGVDHVLGYDDFADKTKELTSGQGVSVAFDGVGAATFDGSLASVRPRGMVVLYGAASGAVPPVDPMRLAAAGSVFLTRPTVAHYTATAEELRSRARDIFNRHHDATLTIATPTQFDFDEVRRAFTALESRSTSGKLVLIH